MLAPIGEALGRDTHGTALGVVQVANAVMARALRRVTVERGVDIRGCTLIAFGGAGPMHACGLAREVGIDHILVPGVSGGFSAYGCISAEPSFTLQRTVRLKCRDWSEDRFDAALAELRAQAAEPLVEAGIDAGLITAAETALLRYVGQSDAVEVPVAGMRAAEDITRAFHEAHVRLYGYATDEPWEVESIRVRASVPATRIAAAPVTAAGAGADLPVNSRNTCWFDGTGPVDTPRIDRDRLPVDLKVQGPAIIEDAVSTVVVEPGATAWTDRFGHLHIRLATGS